MDAFQAIVLGIVQGLTEFLPISSTGHLRIVPAFAGWEDPGAAFTAVIQLGTMAAVVLYFRADLWRIATAWLASLRDPARRAELDARMGWDLIAATVPLVVFGLYGGALADVFDRRTILVITTVGLIGTSGLFWLQAFLGGANVWLPLSLFAVQQAFFAVNQPTRSAVLPKILPLELLPPGVGDVARLLPWAAMAYVPGRIASGHLDPWLIASQVAWLGVSLALAVGVFALGERRLQVVGG